MDAINAGDTAWILVATALVMMMTPALAFFYGGMVRKKNLLSTINLSFITVGLISLQWVIIGYTLAFGTSMGGWIGGMDFFGLTNVGAEPNADYALTIPHLAFSAYQMMFAVITPALITGAFVERVRFKTFLIFSVLWATLVYDPVAHWVWGVGGIFRNMGALDFAGGTVVHITAGFSALAFARVIGQRKWFGTAPLEPSNIPYTMLGAGLLRGKPLLKWLFGPVFLGLTEQGWMKLSRNWAIFFLVLAVANEIMRAALSFDTWLTLKVWGVTVVSLVFAVANMPMLLRHGLDPEKKAEVIADTPVE